jgi:hypothetical protein
VPRLTTSSNPISRSMFSIIYRQSDLSPNLLFEVTRQRKHDTWTIDLQRTTLAVTTHKFAIDTYLRMEQPTWRKTSLDGKVDSHSSYLRIAGGRRWRFGVIS